MRTIVVTIEGNIGSGKTTVIQTLENQFKKLNIKTKVFLEPLHDWKEHLNNFIIDPQKYHYKLQLEVLKSYAKIKIPCDVQLVIIERSKYSAINVFSKHGSHCGYLLQGEFKYLKKLAAKIKYKTDLHLWLKTSVDQCLIRIKNRNRDGEEKLSKKYINQLSRYHEKMNKIIEMEIIDGNQNTKTIAKAIYTSIKKLL